MAHDYKRYFGEIAVLRGLTTITARARELVQDAPVRFRPLVTRRTPRRRSGGSC